MREHRRGIFRWWSIPLGILLGLLALLAFVYFAIGTKGAVQTSPETTAVITLIYAPTSTKIVYEGTVPTPTPELGVITGSIEIGAYVTISGTEGQGLRLRTEPGTSSKIRFLGYESEVFKISDGPTEKDGYRWWNLVAPYDETRTGWAAADFLHPVELEAATATP